MENHVETVKLDHRTQYVLECKEKLADILKDNKILIHYVKDHKNQRKGVLVAAKPSDSPVPLIGWSMCHTPLDRFNKYIGIIKAIHRIENGCPTIDEEKTEPFLPNSVKRLLPVFESRVKRYFKV